MKNVWTETRPRHNSVPQTQDQDTIVYPDTINIIFKIVKLKIEYIKKILFWECNV